MKKLVSALTVLCFALGCASGEAPKPVEKAPAEKTVAQDTHAKPAGETPNAAVTPASGTEVQLTGKMGCGHCNFHIGDSCSAAMQTADGKVYVIDGVAEDSDLFKNRMSGKEIKVAGIVNEVNGIAHIDPKSIM